MSFCFFLFLKYSFFFLSFAIKLVSTPPSVTSFQFNLSGDSCWYFSTCIKLFKFQFYLNSNFKLPLKKVSNSPTNKTFQLFKTSNILNTIKNIYSITLHTIKKEYMPNSAQQICITQKVNYVTVRDHCTTSNPSLIMGEVCWKKESLDRRLLEQKPFDWTTIWLHNVLLQSTQTKTNPSS